MQHYAIMHDATRFEFLRNLDPEALDNEFDRIFPARIGNLSELHWTPVAIAKKAARLAAWKPRARILDAGSGAGKFCIIGASVTDGFFVGVEQREYLVDIARRTADRYRIPRIQFVHENITDVDWSSFDSIYIYNPFSENLDENIRIDELCELNFGLYVKYVNVVQEKLTFLASGTRVVTLNGFGGDFPPDYERAHREIIQQLPLEVWIRK